MENFWDPKVWGSFNLIAVLLISLLIANALKKTIRFLQASLIPTSVLGGAILLAADRGSLFYLIAAYGTVFCLGFVGGAVYERIQTDLDFHLEITRISRNSRLLRQQYALYQQIHLIQISQYTDVKDSLTQILHHKPLVNALRTGDIQEIRHLLCSHTRDFYHIDPYVLMCCGGEV